MDSRIKFVYASHKCWHLVQEVLRFAGLPADLKLKALCLQQFPGIEVPLLD